MRAPTLFVALAALVAAVRGADDDCVYKKGGTRYDLRALRAKCVPSHLHAMMNHH